MFRKSSEGALILAVTLSLGLLGCSGGPKIPATAAVSGKVIYKDQPLADAEVGFVSKLDNKDVIAARGTTNSNGEFTLSTYLDPQHEVSGATPGEYSVVITKVEQKDMSQIMEEFRKNPAMKFEQLIPVKYSNAKSSPLLATVSLDQKNNFEFKLED